MSTSTSPQLAERARYAAELIAPALGSRTAKDAKRFIRLTTQLQDILGEHQERHRRGHRAPAISGPDPQDQKLAHRVHVVLETQHQLPRQLADVLRRLEEARPQKSPRWFKAIGDVGRRPAAHISADVSMVPSLVG